LIPIDFEELLAMGLGTLDGAGVVTGLQVDSRRVQQGDLFVVVGGGNRYLVDAKSRGAAATLVPGNAHSALAEIARAVRARSSARVVGITGSTGKTSTKDILAALCAPVARTVAAEGSFNNEIGVPLTLGRLERDTEICIVELGMRGIGQIAALCSFVRPDVGVISAIGPVHLELVHSVDGVARAKAELVEALPQHGIAVVPDSPDLEPHLRDDIEIRRVPPVDVELTEDGAEIAFAGRRIHFNVRSRHQAQNALTALHAYDALGLPLDRAAEGATNVRLSRWRGEELPLPGGGFIVNDAYNANPTSMRAALEHLAERAADRRRLAVLGEMAELGAAADRYHREIGDLARELGIHVIGVGEQARAYGADTWVTDAEAGLDLLRDLVRPGDAVLVKASRAAALEGIAPVLANDVRVSS
jgi:UDP-N-acetylmuramoyl-tripeptide--D-alanyl-D-alanine ligase